MPSGTTRKHQVFVPLLLGPRWVKPLAFRRSLQEVPKGPEPPKDRRRKAAVWAAAKVGFSRLSVFVSPEPIAFRRWTFSVGFCTVAIVTPSPAIGKPRPVTRYPLLGKTQRSPEAERRTLLRNYPLRSGWTATCGKPEQAVRPEKPRGRGRRWICPQRSRNCHRPLPLPSADPQPVTRRVVEVLPESQVVLGGLDRGMAERDLDLLERRPAEVGELGEGPS